MSTKKLNLSSLSKSRKIDSPLAKYNSAGQLFCVLCNEKVKNEIYWTGHVNGKTHKDNLSNLKRQTTTLKRPLSEPTTKQVTQSSSSSPAVAPPPPVKLQKLSEPEPESRVAQAENELKRLIESNGNPEPTSKEEEQEVPEPPQETLPEGFFDDPKEDAKARGMKFKDPQDAEWDKFVREIATEDIKSSEIVVEEQEKSAVERELDHIEEQMAQWQRVIELEKRASEYVSRSQTTHEQTSEPPEAMQTSTNSDSDDEDDEDFDESLDWRNKKR